MAVPSIPAQGSTTWYTYAQGLDTTTRDVELRTSDIELRKLDANAYYTGGAYPTRSSVTADVLRRVRWVGPIAPPIGGNYAIDGFDVWERN